MALPLLALILLALLLITLDDVVNLRGEVRPAPADPERTLKLGAADARRVTTQGAYVNADEVTAS